MAGNGDHSVMSLIIAQFLELFYPDSSSDSSSGSISNSISGSSSDSRSDSGDSIAYSDATNSSVELIFPFDEGDIETVPLIGIDRFTHARLQNFFDLFDIGVEAGHIQCLDLMETLGIFVILPPSFHRPGLNTRLYHTDPSREGEFSFCLPFAPDRIISWESPDTAFVIEIRDPTRFLISVGYGGRYMGAMHMLEDLYEQLYGSY
ncbi:hypothetical protein TrVFT333_004831 [Trichoderma virens FT-333]|nr:hypothetical protein TrVFT333_004831 [Trichoderma virens FT-333]